MFDYEDEYDRPTLQERWYQQKLTRHPDCRDPDHPGCEACYVDEEENDNSTDQE